MKINQQKVHKILIVLSILLALLTTISAYAKRTESPKADLPYIESEVKEKTDIVKNTLPAKNKIKTIQTTELTILTTTTTTTKRKTTTTTTPTTPADTTVFTGEMKYNITAEERDMLARLLYLEGGSTSRKCQKMIMEVVFNHYEHRGRKSSFTDIVYTKNLFSPAHRIKNTKAKQVQYEIVDEICRDGVTILPTYILYFRAGYYHSWATPYTNINNVYFSYSAKDKK